MIKLITSPSAVTLYVVSILYWITALFVFPRYLIEFADGVAIGCAASVTIIYGRRCLIAMSKSRPDIADMIIVGITGAWTTTAVDRAWRLFARVFSLPLILDKAFVGFLLIMLATFACFHLLVRSAIANGENPVISDRVTMESWGVITIAIISGVAIGLMAVATDRLYIGE